MDRMLFAGKRLAQVDFRAIKWWLRLCETEHGCHLEKSINAEEVSDLLRMIDVKSQCVAPATTMKRPDI